MNLEKFYKKSSYDTLNEPFSAVLTYFTLLKKTAAIEIFKFFTEVEGE